RGYVSPPSWPPGAAPRTGVKWRRRPPNSRLPKRSRPPLRLDWSIVVPIFGTPLPMASSQRPFRHCLGHFFLAPYSLLRQSHFYAVLVAARAGRSQFHRTEPWLSCIVLCRNVSVMRSVQIATFILSLAFFASGQTNTNSVSREAVI